MTVFIILDFIIISAISASVPSTSSAIILFHRVISLHASLLSAYDLGALSALLRAIYDSGSDELSPVYSKGRKEAHIERQDVKLYRENWKQYVGRDK